MPGPEHGRYAEMMSALRGVFDAHARDGVVEMEYETRLYVGEVGVA
jgi:hypothetical protein